MDYINFNRWKIKTQKADYPESKEHYHHKENVIKENRIKENRIKENNGPIRTKN